MLREAVTGVDKEINGSRLHMRASDTAQWRNYEISSEHSHLHLFLLFNI